MMRRALEGAFKLQDLLHWKWLQLTSWIRAQRAATPNSTGPLQLAYQAVTDAADTMEAVHNALADHDYEEAKRLLELGHESLLQHEVQLKGLL